MLGPADVHEEESRGRLAHRVRRTHNRDGQFVRILRKEGRLLGEEEGVDRGYDRYDIKDLVFFMIGRR